MPELLLLTKCCGIVGSVVEGRVYLDELRLLVENTLNKTGAAAAGGAAAGGAAAGTLDRLNNNNNNKQQQQ